MFKTQNPLFLVPFKFGFIGSLMIILALLVLFYLDRHPLLLNPILDARIPLYALIIFISFKVFKDQYSGGVLHFWQGMTMGMIAYILMAFGAALFIYIFSSLSGTHFLSEYIRISTGQLVANKDLFIETIGEKTYTDTLAQLPNTRPIHLAVDYLLKSMPIGLFLSLILSILLRNKVSTNQI
jgi:Protein of unknown function (DUF4199)